MAKLTREDVERIVAETHDNGEIPDFRGADLSEIDLSGVNFYKADLYRANLYSTHLKDAFLNKANLRMANLNGANLNKAYLHATSLQEANLSGASLRAADLSGANFNGANLNEANLRGADLGGADFSEANLSGANLRGADFYLTNLTNADLSRTILHGANIEASDFKNANLELAELGGTMARMGTVFANVDLRSVRGLVAMKHKGPSTIGTDTLQKSGGWIPIEFLRGCGLSDWEIEAAKLYQPNLSSDEIINITYEIHRLRADNPSLFYSCFLIYTREDEAFGQKLFQDLQNNGVRCWAYEKQLRGGRKRTHQINEAITLHEKFILILSDNILDNEEFNAQVRHAHKADLTKPLSERESRFFPIRLMGENALRYWECSDPQTGNDLAAEVREYVIPDFSNWQNPDAYDEAFQKLLADLRKGRPSLANE